MELKIRESIPEDVYAIRKVQRETWLKTYPNEDEGITVEDIEEKFSIDDTEDGKKKMEERKKRYEDKNRKTWVAEENGKVIGFCAAVRGTETNRLQAIYVLPDHQGKGIGKILVEKAFDFLGLDKDILVNVARYNSQAICFYKYFGFKETGKTGIWDDAAKLPSGKIIYEIELVKKANSLGSK